MKNPWEDLLPAAEKLKAAVEEEIERARSYLAGAKTRGFVPVLTAVCRDPDLNSRVAVFFLVDADMNDHDKKREALEALGVKVYLMKVVPVAAMLTTECWRSVSREGRPPVLPPRDDPEREEGVICQGVVAGGKVQATAFLPVSRDYKNRIVPGTPEPTWTEGGEFDLLDHFFHGFLLAARANDVRRN